MTHLIELETERLRLRQWTPADREPFAALNSDARVMQYLSDPLTRAASDALADRCQTLIEERGWGFWVAECRVTRDCGSTRSLGLASVRAVRRDRVASGGEVLGPGARDGGRE